MNLNLTKQYHRVLSIAGSDSSGGAGIQADIKAISALDCYAATAITAVTAQNTLGVSDIHPIPVKTVTQQIEVVLTDIGIDAVKIGMLHNAELILAVKEVLLKNAVESIVLDPVMVATSGDKLLEDAAIETLLKELVPIAKLITPNIPEAEILLGKRIDKQSAIKGFAKELAVKYRTSVLLKAGHLTDEILTDVLYNVENDSFLELSSKRLTTKNSHGTGCTLSSAIAAGLAKGLSLDQAVVEAKEYLRQALIAGDKYEIGKGHGPVHHFYAFWGNS